MSDANTMLLLLTSLLLLAGPPAAAALSHGPVGDNPQFSRRDALLAAGGGLSAAAAASSRSSSAVAAPLEAETVDLAAFNAARRSTDAAAPSSLPNAVGKVLGAPETTYEGRKIRRTIVPSADPPPVLGLRGSRGGGSRVTVPIPRVGHSLYKTPSEQAGRCVALALRCGVRHFDVGALYGTNAEAAKPLNLYLSNGLPGLTNYYKDEKPELLAYLDAVSMVGERHARAVGYNPSAIPVLDGSAGRRARRETLFVSHKVSNDEQSADALTVKRRVKAAIAELGVTYLDLVSLHSPLTDRARRLASYRALLELRDAGFVRSVGVCNYGVGALEEIAAAFGGEDLPAIDQLELSPFNTHSDVTGYCDANGIAVGCAAWSKLSGADGPAEGWSVVADLAGKRGVTKAQVLVRWALQRGYVCVPRSGCGSRVERVAIAENSYGGTNDRAAADADGGASFRLSEDEMKVLDGLDVGYRAGKLGRRDGWGDADVSGPGWDPTDFV